MKKKIIVIIFVSLLSVLLLTACPPNDNGDGTHTPPEKEYLPPLLCYDLEPSIELENPIIHTKTQFGEERDIVLDSPFMLCEPISKAHEAEDLDELPMLNPLICYLTPYSDDEINEQVSLYSKNEIYTGDAIVWQYWIFCDPVESKVIEWGETPESDRFPYPLLFYQIEPVDKIEEGQIIFTRDQFFHSQEITLGYPIYLAEPVNKTHEDEEPIKDPPEDIHPYVCFGVEDSEFEDLGMPAILEDQFHNEPFEVYIERPVIFCDPTKKIH